MGYDEEMANANESLIEKRQQRSDQYNENGNHYSDGSDVGLVKNSNSTGISSGSNAGNNDSLIHSYKQMVKEGGPGRSAGISNNNGLGVILEDRNLVAAAKVEVIETKQNLDPYQKKQRDDDEFYMSGSSRGNSLVTSYKNLVTERATSVDGISSLGGSMNGSNAEYQRNEGHRRTIKSSINNGYHDSNDRSFRKSSNSSVMSGNLTEPDCWEEEAEYHDNGIGKPINGGESSHIRFRKTTVCFMASIIFMLIAVSAFFFSVWYNEFRTNDGSVQMMPNSGRGGNENSTFLFRDKCVSEGELQELQNQNGQLGEEIANLVAMNQELKDKWNATVIDLEGQVVDLQTTNSALEETVDNLKAQNGRLYEGNSLQEELNKQLNSKIDDSNTHNGFLSTQISLCTGKYNDIEAAIDLLKADAALTSKQREDMEEQNGKLLGDVDSLQGDKLILENLKESLDKSIDSLEDQINDLSEQNDVLNATVKEFKNNIGDLENTNNVYKQLNDQFNASISNLSDENIRLENQVNVYANLNKELNATAQELGSEVAKLQGEVSELSTINDRLDASMDKLAEETENLQESNVKFKKNVDELSSNIEQLSGENDQLQASNNKLETIVGFLNETSQRLGETYDDITAFLAEQITANRVLVLEGTQNTYHQRLNSWDCNFADRFRAEDFSSNGNTVIPRSKSNTVMKYIDERVLSDLCLSPTDFAQFVEGRYGYNYDKPGTTITTNQLVTAVQRYSYAAFDYYFPDDDAAGSGLTEEDWAQAGYNCDNLPERKHFIKVKEVDFVGGEI